MRPSRAARKARRGTPASALSPASLAVTAATDPARVLRRMEWLAAALGVAGALFLLLGRRSPGGALVLTLAAAASIFAFRGLQTLVGQLAAGSPKTRRPIDSRSRRLVWLRFSLLTLAPLISLWMDSERALGLVMGFSVIPLAAVTEGLLQLGFVLMGRREHGR